jgi:flagellar FliL protein
MALDPITLEVQPAPPTSNKKIIIIVLAVLLVAGAAAGGAWFFMQKKDDHQEKVEAKHEEPAVAPVFLTLETFTVNLQPDPDEKFLQLDLSIQLANPEAAEILKLQMPAVRNRLLMLLTSKKASQISLIEGKTELSDEIADEMRKPFAEGAKPQEVTGVFFTSFVIQ